MVIQKTHRIFPRLLMLRTSSIHLLFYRCCPGFSSTMAVGKTIDVWSLIFISFREFLAPPMGVYTPHFLVTPPTRTPPLPMGCTYPTFWWHPQQTIFLYQLDINTLTYLFTLTSTRVLDEIWSRQKVTAAAYWNSKCGAVLLHNEPNSLKPALSSTACTMHMHAS